MYLLRIQKYHRGNERGVEGENACFSMCQERRRVRKRGKKKRRAEESWRSGREKDMKVGKEKDLPSMDRKDILKNTKEKF